MSKYKYLLLLIFFTGVLPGSIVSQSDSIFTNPHATIYNHLYYLQHDSYEPEKSAQSFNMDIQLNDRIDYAVKLKQILDGKGLYVQMSKIPEDPEFLDSTYLKKQYYLFPTELPEVFVEFKNGRWQYGDETISAIPGIHKKTYPLGTDRLLNLVSGNPGKTFWGLFSWQYLGILLIIVIASILFLVLRLLLRPILKRIGKLSFHINLEDQKLLRRTSHILSLLIVFVLIKYIVPVLQLPAKWNLFTIRALDIIITVFIALLLLRILDYIISYFRTVADKTESKMDDQLLPIVSQIIKLIIIIAATLQVLHLVNVNVTALIAGISIGGLALALAAKDTVSNLIGSLMIFLDKPFQIGDFIEVDGQSGTIVEVGFRSTRLQTKDTSVISIPNGTIANSTLTNKGIRVFRLFEMTLGVTYDTPADLIEVFIDGLQKLAEDHPKVINEDQYIHMSGFADSSLNILFRIYLDTTNYAGELALKEEISLTILRMADALGVRFAFPSTTVYVEQFPGQKDLIPDYPVKEAINEKLENYLKKLKEDKS